MRYPTYLKTIGHKKKRRKLKLAVLFVFLVLFSIAAYSVKTEIYGGSSNESVLVEIKAGSTVTQVAELLKEKQIIRYPVLFKIYAKLKARTSGIQLGGHTLTKAMSYSQIIDTISETTMPTDVATVTIPEGSEILQTANTIAQAFEQRGYNFSVDTFLNECDNGNFDYPFVAQITRTKNRLEGYLFPATYNFTQDMTEHDIIDAMLAVFNREYTEEFSKSAAEQGFSTDEIITLASIIEREGVGVEDFNTVSSVFRNRLKNKMRLDSCATIQYILGERKEVLSIADTKIASPYNTYLNFGLPVGPIASPGVAAIRAALYPADTEYLYFRLNDGQHVFSRTYREHQQAAQ
ncbi:MAG: endolytic transglycosylase MltG [Clostridiaceae bacterium]|nr:endolytic transglycosylase MltG [Clostridiaceae bacterium]